MSAPADADAQARAAAVLRLTASRLLQALLVALVVGVAGFAMMEALPGDAAYRIAAGRYGYDVVSGAAADQVRAELGLDRPAWVRLGEWLGKLATLDLGRSPVTGEPIAHVLDYSLTHSAALALVALLVAMAIALPLGCAAGLWTGSAFDRTVTGLSIGLRATPAFLLGIVLMLLLGVELRLLPTAGHTHAANLALPALTLGLLLAAVLTQVVRGSVADAVASESFQFARLKGLSMPVAFWRHGVRAAAVPVVAYLGVQAVLLLEAVVVVESVFSWPGIGHALTHAVFERDVPMIQGTALTLGLAFVLLTFLVDLAGFALDPRSRP